MFEICLNSMQTLLQDGKSYTVSLEKQLNCQFGAEVAVMFREELVYTICIQVASLIQSSYEYQIMQNESTHTFFNPSFWVIFTAS
jgi:hypothetical protein